MVHGEGKWCRPVNGEGKWCRPVSGEGSLRSQTLYLEKQRGKGLVKLPWQIGSDLTGFLRC